MKQRTLWILTVVMTFCLGMVYHLFHDRSGKDELAMAAGKPTPRASQIVRDVETAILNALDERKGFMPVAALYTTSVERVSISGDEAWASAWLVPLDPQTGEPVETEPGLALLKQEAGEWQVALPGDFTWTAWLTESPDDLLPAGEKEYWQMVNAAELSSAYIGPLGGYRLPWEGGVRGTLTGSLAHDAYLDCRGHFSFDFIIIDPSTGRGGLYPILAAKGGTVWKYWDGQPRGDESAPGNYIVLRDATTNPVTYQLYLHLDQGSIPPALKSIGRPVQQGEMIGVADDTGMSTGHHLHFMVHTNPNSYWGQSVDITFDDVTINGGRPRIFEDLAYCNKPGGCAETGGYTDVCSNYQRNYISGNVGYDPNPPTGGLTMPVHQAQVNTSQVVISGWAQDDISGLKSAQVRAYYSGAWHAIGAAFTTSPFSFTWDMCQAQVEDGPVTFALSLLDKKNNPAELEGLATIIKNYNCPLPSLPPPACTPTANQVALFTQSNYQGNCYTWGVGSYDIGEISLRIGDDTAASALVGANVRATLYAAASFGGRSETLWQSDSNLEDNLVGSQSLSSLQVRLKSDLPVTPLPVYPAAGSVITQTLSLNLYWRDRGGAAEYQARLLRGADVITSTWQVDPYWNLGTGLNGMALTTGAYSWQVRARNAAGQSAWSAAQAFTIIPDSLPVSIIPAPFAQDFETDSGGWTGTGYWRLIDTKPVDNPTRSWWFGTFDGDFGHHYFYRKSGDLTSPEIYLPDSEVYYLRFKYRAQTESPYRFYDQRWVQIKVGDEPFRNVYQVTDDLRLPYSQPDILWMQSPVISLADYRGQVIRIRFHFDTIDPSFKSIDNDYEGWYIDEVSVTAQPPPACLLPDEPNNTPTQGGALDFAPASPAAAELCPAGDVDYFKFIGKAGDRLSANLDKLSPSDLDAHLTLLDSDGGSVLAVNDDEKHLELTDPLLIYELPRDGTYYLKVKAWDHPGAGSPDYQYALILSVDDDDPLAQFINLQKWSVVYPGLDLQVLASDAISGVDRVEWYLHGSQWADPGWIFLGKATFSQGRWHFLYPAQPSQPGAALMALVYDKAGQVTPLVAWDVAILSSYYSYRFPMMSR